MPAVLVIENSVMTAQINLVSPPPVCYSYSVLDWCSASKKWLRALFPGCQSKEAILGLPRTDMYWWAQQAPWLLARFFYCQSRVLGFLCLPNYASLRKPMASGERHYTLWQTSALAARNWRTFLGRRLCLADFLTSFSFSSWRPRNFWCSKIHWLGDLETTKIILISVASGYPTLLRYPMPFFFERLINIWHCPEGMNKRTKGHFDCISSVSKKWRSCS